MRVHLRTKKDKQLKQGYPWIFKNQLDRTEGEPTTGDVVEIVGADGVRYGRGFYHAESLIAVRFLTRDLERPIDAAFFRERLEAALRLRQGLYPDPPHYRLAFSESDGLPGTIIDRYGDVLTWSCVCAGMAQRRDLLLDLLEELLEPQAIVERNDSWLRAKDGLPASTSVLRGALPETVLVQEGPVQMHVDMLAGPKTGLFLDQRGHRNLVGRLAQGRHVLDVCCADGGFGLQAALGGAASVHFLDIAPAALERVQRNVALNAAHTPDLPDRCTYEAADALDHLPTLRDRTPAFDFIVLDPPGFAKQRRQVEQATRAYQRLNITALQMLPPGGLLATSSCSGALPEADFLKIIEYSARKAGVRLRLLHHGSQPPDHPTLMTMGETRYLKFFLFEHAGPYLPA
ncbi:MAG: class I SAM-dependent rRNA methyltransferase [Bacteroidota bacterium]